MANLQNLSKTFYEQGSGSSRPAYPSLYEVKKIGMVRVFSGNIIIYMDYIEKVLEKLKEWTRKLVEALLGPQAEPEPEPIPIPVSDRSCRRSLYH